MMKTICLYRRLTIMARFKKGESGNKNGRPKGALNKSTLAAQELMAGELEGITRKCIEMALEGDLTAIKLILDRSVPTMKPIDQTVSIPALSGTLVAQGDQLIQSMAEGEISLGEGTRLISALVSQSKIMLGADIEARLNQKIAEPQKVIFETRPAVKDVLVTIGSGGGG
jgi:hypothetical protein